MNSPIKHYVNYAGEEAQLNTKQEREEKGDWEIAARGSFPKTYTSI
jgi:hypothetical protein